jgi:outer membrane protein assembly factor BamB
MESRASLPVISGLLAALLLVSACAERGTITGPDDSVEGAPESSASAPELPAFDPPTRFDAENEAVLIAETSFDESQDLAPPVALHGTQAFALDNDGMRIIDLAAGDSSAPLEAPESDSTKAYDEQLEAPWILETDDDALALVPFLADKPTSGTQTPGYRVELVAFDIRTAEPAWTALVDLPGWGAGDWVDVDIVGADQETVILGVYGYDYDAAQTIAVSVRTQEILWSDTDFWPRATVGDLLIGYRTAGERSPLTARTMADGAEVWAQAERSGGYIAAVSPDLIAVSFDDEWDEYHVEQLFEYSFQFLDTATGEPVAVYDLAWEWGVSCVFDGTEFFACDGYVGLSNGTTIGYSATTGELLWELPAEGRISADVTTAWHGVVYGLTDNGPVVLDAATGADVEGEPGMAPFVVNEYAGVGIRGEEQVTLAAAIG